MPSHGSCSRCSRPLLVESADALCPVCRAATGLPATTPIGRQPSVGPGTTGSDPGDFDLADLPLPPDLLLTPPDPTRTGPAGAATLPAEAVREYLPAAPPGYALIRRLGRGGMGAVFLALELAPQRTVAIKFLNAPSAPGAFVRFLAEVRALARLNHPNIVQVIAVETNWREPFFTMEYVPGGTLADLVADGAPPVRPAEAARLMLGAAEAVAAAHAARVVHRDLKPSNILLSEVVKSSSRQVVKSADGAGPSRLAEVRPDDLKTPTPKVSDFGLAKRTDQDEDLTKTGPIGTASYMSPEAARGRHREVGVAADIYGLGATLYHLLAGRPPFRGRDRDDTMARVVRDPLPRLRAIRPDVPAGLEAVVTKAMEKDPGRRYASAGEFAADLRRFLAGQEPTAPPLTPGRRAVRWLRRNGRRLAAAAGLVLLTAGLVWGGFILAPRPPDPDAAVRAIDAELAAGRPVALVPARGYPVWHRWAFGPTALGLAPHGGGTCSFEAIDHALLELHPGLDLDRYEVSAELLLDPTLPGVPPVLPAPGVEQTRSSLAGLYFGRWGAVTDDGAAAQAFLAVSFADYAPPQVRAVGVEASAQVLAVGLVARPERTIDDWHDGVADCPPVRFPSVPAPPGRWRGLRLAVEPDRVRAWWRADPDDPTAPPEPLADLTPDHLAGATARQQAAVAGRLGVGRAAVPGWTPGTPLGVWCRQGKVSVRNVIVRPLP